jgi:hypothetical protein
LINQSFDSVKPIPLSHGRRSHLPLVLVSINAMEQGSDST